MPQIIKVGNNFVTVGGDTMQISNLEPENIKSGMNVGGVVGTYEGDVPSLQYMGVESSDIVFADLQNTIIAHTLTISNVEHKPQFVGFFASSTNSTYADCFKFGFIDLDGTHTQFYNRNNNLINTQVSSYTYDVDAKTLTMTVTGDSSRGFNWKSFHSFWYI